MPSTLALLALLAPVIICGAAFTLPSNGDTAVARRGATVAIWASSLALATAGVVAGLVALFGPLRSGLVGAAGIGLSLNVDALSAILLLLVAFVGVVVVRYSRNYLAGDAGQLRFTRWLLLALASVLTLIVSGNLALLIAAWIATSLALNELLLFYRERPAAERAARKKFVASRVGDLALVAAAALLYATFGTLEIADIVARAKAAPDALSSPAITIAGLLIVLTAMLKSAQLPMHGWLLEVMETPTPVSALLHAGIINAGGFLVLRLADVLLIARPALDVLAMVGGATALAGSLVMLTQTSVKVQLAWSTIAQMGFMLLQCGLGAFSSALLHIVAHSLYKAHAFLSSGSIIDLARAAWTPAPGEPPRPARLAVAIVGALVLMLGAAALFGVTLANDPGRLALFAVVLIGLVQLVVGTLETRPPAEVIRRVATIAGGVLLAYVGLQALIAWLVAGSLPSVHPGGLLQIAIAVLVVVSFAAVTLLQARMLRAAEHPFWIALYVHLRNGLYLNSIANRLVLELWPQRKGAAAGRS